MPLSGGTSGAHDDSMHQGSAKRDVAEGLAGLDVGGHVLAPGYRFTAARGAAEQITIRERTSDERVFRLIRIGANDYEARVNVGGVEKVVQHAGLKDVVNGIAALDAAGALLLPGSKMYFTRDGSDDVHIYERTSDEEAYAFHRVGADDYTFFVKESNVWKRMQTESMKDIADGIAGLDANSKIAVSAIAGLGKIYVIGDADLHDHNTFIRITDLSWTKVKTITINDLGPSPSTMRTYFTIQPDNANLVYGRIYKNGAPYGTSRSTTNISGEGFTEDLSFADGDTVELWCYTSAAAIGVSQFMFQIKGSTVQNTFQDALDTSYAGLLVAFAATNSMP